MSKLDFLKLVILSVIPTFLLGTYLLRNTGGHGVAGFYGGLFVGVSIAIFVVYGYYTYKDSRK